ncbi:MAG: hypothetical protein ACRDK7_03285 [Solirubrobacteraceae bacterium]
MATERAGTRTRTLARHHPRRSVQAVFLEPNTDRVRTMKVVPVSNHSLMLANSTFRMAYGVGALLAPSTMAKLRLAAGTREDPQSRLFVRGFGSHQVAVAALGLASRRWPTLERPAALAALAIDAVDMLSAVVESSERGSIDADLTGGLVFSAAGVATATGVLWEGFA